MKQHRRVDQSRFYLEGAFCIVTGSRKAEFSANLQRTIVCHKFRDNQTCRDYLPWPRRRVRRSPSRGIRGAASLTERAVVHAPITEKNMNPRLRSGLVVASLVALFAGACSVGTEEEDGAEVAAALVSSDGAVSATIPFNDWGSGYTGNVTVTNNGNTPTTSWTVVVDSARRRGVTDMERDQHGQRIPHHVQAALVECGHPGRSVGELRLQRGSRRPDQPGAARPRHPDGFEREAARRPAAPRRAARAAALVGAGERRAAAAAAVGAGPAAPAGGCSPATYEAEAMTHSTGGAQDSGWNIWSNGNIATTASFGGGSTTLTVTAKGTSAGGVWPNMVVKVDGVQIGSATVNTASYAGYPFTVAPAAGLHTA